MYKPMRTFRLTFFEAFYEMFLGFLRLCSCQEQRLKTKEIMEGKNMNGKLRILSLILVLGGCNAPKTPLFTYGPPREIDVEGQFEVFDGESGLTFIFSEGGKGSLTVREILSGPPRPFAGGRGFEVSYPGGSEFFVRVSVAENEEAGCWGWGFMDGSADDGVSRDGRWVPIPGVEENATWIYRWVMPYEVPSQKPEEGRLRSALIPRSNHRGFSQYWINSVKPDASDAERRIALAGQVELDIQSWIAVLPPTLQQTVRARVAAMPYRLYWDGSYYIGFTRSLLWTVATPMIGLRVDSDANTVAHEVGHYMTHVLAGDEAYLAMEDTAPDENHGLGTWQPGRPLVEDYAYFSQFLLTGAVGAADPTVPRLLLWGIDPRKVDMPGVEGFGTVLLASLVRTANSTVSVFSAQLEPVPVVGASLGEVATLYVLGAASVDALRPHLENFVATRGKAGALAVLAERAGWSYAAKGRVLDQGGQPVQNAQVSNILNVAGTDYDTGDGGTATTDSNGRFKLKRMFFGTSVLRIKLSNGEEKDVTVKIDPASPTNQEIDLGDILVFSGPKSFRWCETAFSADITRSVRVGPFLANESDVVSTMAGQTFNMSWSLRDEYSSESGEIEVNFSPTFDQVISFSGSVGRSFVFCNEQSVLEGHDLPFAMVTTDGRWVFEVRGQQACSHVDRGSFSKHCSNGDNESIDAKTLSCSAGLDSFIMVWCE